MSQEKAQLIAPIDSSFSVPGLTVSGVLTATTFDGTITGVADSITQGKNLNVGVITALSFSGNLTGDAGGLIGSPNTVAGVVTANSFVGGITGNITGDVIGNASGIGASIKQGNNLNVGIATAVEWYGDGSGVTGAGSSAYVAQEVTASGAETIIDLSYGNFIYYKGEADTTVGFASTSAAEQLTFIRDTDSAYSISYSTGGVDFDGNDALTAATSSDYSFGTGDYTVEFWFNADAISDTPLFENRVSGSAGDTTGFTLTAHGAGAGTNGVRIWWTGASRINGGGSSLSTGSWFHLAATRSSGTTYLFLDGTLLGTTTDSIDVTSTEAHIAGGKYGGSTGLSHYFDGKISNFRMIKGTALYTTNFVPPSAALTNVTNTKLLCCQSDSSATAATVIATGSITAVGDPTAGAQTITKSGSLSATITWPDRVNWNGGTTPTLFTNARSKASQIFHFTTVDTGLNYNAWEEIKNNAETFGLYAAGPSGYGSLGINVAPGTNYSSPVQVPGTSWSSLAPTGFQPSVMGAIKSDGTMWVWGSTNYGILGLNVYGAGLSDSVSSPIQLGTETTWDNACFGGNNSAGCMAVKTDGSLWGWGQNRYGTLGLNDAGIPGSLPSEYQNSRSSPTQVGTDTTWKFVNYAGDDCIYGIKTNGTLWSWGGAGAGQLGQNTPGTTPSLRSSPVQVGTDTSWAFASGGRNGHAIATKTDGTLWCWGDNSKGALGLNESEVGAPTWTSPQRSSPTQVGSGTDWNYDNEGKISAGYQRVFAIKTNGTLWGWGRSHQGQLGLNEGGYKDYSSPVQIPGTNWATISNVSEVIATKTDGTLWTWGDNGEGKGMLNSDVDRSSPTQVPGTWSTGKRGIRSGGPQCALKVE